MRCIYIVVMEKVQVMKRIPAFIAALAACLFFSLPSGAQGKHEINAYIGGFNSQYVSAQPNQNNDTDLYGMYEPQYRFSSGPVVTLDYNYALLSWLSVSAQFNYGKVSGTEWRRADSSINQFARESFSLLPGVKMRIPSPRHFRLYGRASIGVRYTNNGTFDFAWDLVPLGVEWGGQRVYGTAEGVFGNIIKGGRIGIGFRF